MISAARHRTGALRRVCLALAAIAMMLEVLVPPGFMVGKPADQAPFALVLCTAQGMVTVAASDPVDDPAGQPDGAVDVGPCAFAAASQIAPLPFAATTPAVFIAVERIEPRFAVHLAPGRGLAAPPPPARGPPSLLT